MIDDFLVHNLQKLFLRLLKLMLMLLLMLMLMLMLMLTLLSRVQPILTTKTLTCHIDKKHFTYIFFANYIL